MRRERGESRLATILFTDIVGSSEIASQLGDRRYRVLIARHHSLVRRELRRFQGREIDTAGDGFFAAFEAPASAVRCACAISDEVRELGIEIRAGLHVGEAEVVGRKLGGTTVHITARVMALAAAGEVLVTGTVRDLVPGSGFGFSHGGRHTLKGLPGEWDLYAVTAVEGHEREPPANPAESARIREGIEAPPLLQRRGGRLAVGAALLGAVVISLVALSTVRNGPAPSDLAHEDRLVRIDAESGKVAAVIKSGSAPGGVAVLDGAVWTTSSGTGTVSRINPGRNRVDETFDVGRRPVGIAAGSVAEGGKDLVWVANIDDTTISAVDPSTGHVATTRITAERTAPGPLPPSATGGMVLGEGALWIRADEGNLTRVDLATGQQTSFVAHSLSERAFAAGENGFWAGGDSLQRFDPKRPADGPVATVELPAPTTGIAVGAGSVWVCTTDGSLLRVDPHGNHLIEFPIPVGLHPKAIAVGAGSLWVTSGDGVILQVFLGTTRVARTIPVGGDITGIAVGAGDVWVSVDAPDTV